MKSLLLALQFLTISPIKIKSLDEKELARSAAYFPAAGLLLGLALVAINTLLSSLQIYLIASNAIIVVALAILTGGLHLDGLSDSADALFSGKDKIKSLEIMRDPHTGAMGVLAMVSIILLKIAFLSSINSDSKNMALILMCVFSRWSIVLSLFAFPYARSNGKAKVFADGMNKKIFAAATFLTLIVAFIAAGPAGIILMSAAAIFTYIAGLFIKRKIDGITGDTVGAVCELTEVVVLACIVILERIL